MIGRKFYLPLFVPSLVLIGYFAGHGRGLFPEGGLELRSFLSSVYQNPDPTGLFIRQSCLDLLDPVDKNPLFNQRRQQARAFAFLTDIPRQEAAFKLPTSLGGSSGNFNFWGTVELQVSPAFLPNIINLKLNGLNVTIPGAVLQADWDGDKDLDRVEIADITISPENLDPNRTALSFNLLTGKFYATFVATLNLTIRIESGGTAPPREEVIEVKAQGQGWGMFDRFNCLFRGASGSVFISNGPLAGTTIVL